jgi:Uma2 family endonuclease
MATVEPMTSPAVAAEPMATMPSAAPTRLDRQHRITVDEYNRMLAAGVFGKKRVFLWKGRIIDKMPKFPAHNYGMAALNLALARLLPAGWFHTLEQPVVLGDDSMPEPDFLVVRGVPRDYVNRQKRPEDVALAIEVADSSVAEDRGEALVEYARDGIPTYWIVNIPEHQVEVYTEPTGPADAPGYRHRRDYKVGESIPIVLDGHEVGQIAVEDIVPPAEAPRPGADRP